MSLPRSRLSPTPRISMSAAFSRASSSRWKGDLSVGVLGVVGCQFGAKGLWPSRVFRAWGVSGELSFAV